MELASRALPPLANRTLAPAADTARRQLAVRRPSPQPTPAPSTRSLSCRRPSRVTRLGRPLSSFPLAPLLSPNMASDPPQDPKQLILDPDTRRSWVRCTLERAARRDGGALRDVAAFLVALEVFAFVRTGALHASPGTRPLSERPGLRSDSVRGSGIDSERGDVHPADDKGHRQSGGPGTSSIGDKDGDGHTWRDYMQAMVRVSSARNGPSGRDGMRADHLLGPRSTATLQGQPPMPRSRRSRRPLSRSATSLNGS